MDVSSLIFVPSLLEMTPLTEIVARLKAARMERGWSQEEMAAKMGVPTVTYVRWETEAHHPSFARLMAGVDEIRKTEPALFERVMAEAIEPTTRPLETTSLPYWGTVPAGNWEQPTTDDGIRIEVPAQFARPGERRVFRVAGDSMAPALMRGDLLIVQLMPQPPIGSIVIARSDAQELTVKRYIFEDGHRLLVSDNPAFPPIEPKGSTLIGQVMHLIREAL